MKDYVKIKMYVGTGYHGVEHEDYYEYPRDEWEAMSEDQRVQVLNDMALEFLHERCECSAWVEEE